MKYKKTIVVGIIVLAISFIMIALFNSTYAFFSTDDYAVNPDVYSTGLLLIEATSKSENISLTNAIPMTDEDGLDSVPYVFTIKNVGNLDYKFDVKLLSTGDSTTTITPIYIRLQIDDGEVLSLSDLDNSVIKSDMTLLAGESIDISIRIWLSINTPNTEIGKSFNSSIVTDGQAVYIGEKEAQETLVDHIANLYNNAEKSTFVNNGLTYYQAKIYDTDTEETTSGGLMNDRLGTSDVGLDNGNIRYYGAKPNNYIDIGDTEINSNGEEVPTLYRIIGLFKDMTVVNDDNTTEQKDLIKVIRINTIGGYSWDQYSNVSTNDNGANEWSQADLMKLLNPGYQNENIGGSLYWNNGSGTCYGYDRTSMKTGEISCNFSTIGPDDSIKSKIERVYWNLGGLSSPSIYPDQSYNGERSNAVIQDPADEIIRTTIWPGKIALLYPSDYGYASDLICNAKLNSFSSCKNTNWIYTGLLSSVTAPIWTLTPSSTSTSSAYEIRKDGSVFGDIVNHFAFFAGYYDSKTFPTFYLNPDLLILSGDGSEGNPYVV